MLWVVGKSRLGLVQLAGTGWVKLESQLIHDLSTMWASLRSAEDNVRVLLPPLRIITLIIFKHLHRQLLMQNLGQFWRKRFLAQFHYTSVGNYYFDEISRYLAIYISTILRPLTCSVVELIQLLLLYTERNAAVIPRLNGRFFFRSIDRTKRGRYLTT